MIYEQHTYAYPRRLRFLVELLSTMAVLVALVVLIRALLRFYLQVFGASSSPLFQLDFVQDAMRSLTGTLPPCCVPFLSLLPMLLPSLAWMALALLMVLLVRSGLPTIRTSARGMLVEFAGDWLPIPWESIQTIKVTEAHERYMLLVETDGKHLTGWHRLYSFIYRMGFKQGFLISSRIEHFDELIRTLLGETDRVARVLQARQGAQLQEDASSPLFRLLLSPSAFFIRRDKVQTAENDPANASTSSQKVKAIVRGSYPRSIGSLLRSGAYFLAVLTTIRVLIMLMTYVALVYPAARSWPLFDRLIVLNLPAPWWLLVSAAISAILLAMFVAMMRYLLPDVEGRNEGLAVRYFRRWYIVPWEQFVMAKHTELSEKDRIVLLQTSGGLPFLSRFSSLLYDRSFQPGVLVTSALSCFEELLSKIVLSVMKVDPVRGPLQDERPIFQSKARSHLLLGLLNSERSVELSVDELREQAETKQLSVKYLFTSARTMIILALMPALILFADRALMQSILPDMRLIVIMLVLFFVSMLEWPLVALASIVLDESTGGGEEGNRVWYLYPRSQQPRMIAMLAVLALTLLAVPVLPIVIWFVALVWIFILAAALWSALYDWRGNQLLMGGLIPVAFQLLLIVAFALVRT